MEQSGRDGGERAGERRRKIVGRAVAGDGRRLRAGGQAIAHRPSRVAVRKSRYRIFCDIRFFCSNQFSCSAQLEEQMWGRADTRGG